MIKVVEIKPLLRFITEWLRVKIPSFTGLLSTDSGVSVNYRIDTDINDPVPIMTLHAVYQGGQTRD